MVGAEVTSRVVWPPLPDTQTTHANKGVFASKADVVSFPSKSVAPSVRTCCLVFTD